MIDLTVYSFKNFHIFDEEEKKHFIDIIFNNKDKYISDYGYNEFLTHNVEIEKCDYTNTLYNKFLQCSQDKFGPFNLLENNSNKCYALLTNIDNYASVPHDHIQTSVINSVYYLSVPRGEIQFLIDDKWINYQPVENELIIFPNYLKHNTLKNNTKQWRISINMEIMCDYKWSN
jgi:hypothetical protein